MIVYTKLTLMDIEPELGSVVNICFILNDSLLYCNTALNGKNGPHHLLKFQFIKSTF